MKNNRVLPFQNMTSRKWQNLALVAILIFYLAQIGFDLLAHNLCGNLAVDYCAYWSTGKVINTYGYSNVYNVDLVTQTQKNIFPYNPSAPYDVLMVAHLPIFFVPFQVLSVLNVEAGFWIWTLLNLIGYILYLRFFTKQVTGNSPTFRMTIMIMLSLPIFLNLFWGQVNVWLGICAGEFMRAILSKKPFRAGLWLGGWWLKPQLLILIIPFLLFQRSIKALVGFTASTLAILIASFALVGKDGFFNLTKLYFEFAQGMPGNGPEIMMNWRMLGLHITYLISPILGWLVVICGTVITLFAVSIILKKPLPVEPIQLSVILLGLWAATGAITWHAHLSMSMVLIPPMIYLYVTKRFPEKLFTFWVFMPSAVMFIVYIMAALMQAKVLPAGTAELLNLLGGLRGFVLNMALLGWTLTEYKRNETENYPEKLSNNELSKA